MATLHVRNVPDSLYERLRRQAEAENRSLSAELVILLDRALESWPEPADVLERARHRRYSDLVPVGAAGDAGELHVMHDGAALEEEIGVVRLDDQLVAEARQIGRHPTGSDAVTAALEEYIARQRQRAVLDLFGTVEYDPGYDYKVQRRRS